MLQSGSRLRVGAAVNVLMLALHAQLLSEQLTPEGGRIDAVAGISFDLTPFASTDPDSFSQQLPTKHDALTLRQQTRGLSTLQVMAGVVLTGHAVVVRRATPYALNSTGSASEAAVRANQLRKLSFLHDASLQVAPV